MSAAKLTAGSAARLSSLWLITPVFLLLALPVEPLLGQEGELSEAKVLQAARETMEAARYCFLVTLDDTGQPQARLMDPFLPEDDMTVWLGTNANTRKVRQIRNDERATLAYYDATSMGYVTLVGTVRMVDDLEERREHWKPDWEEFYPDGPAADNYVLIEFMPSRIEVMSFVHGVMGGAFAPAALDRKGSGWVLERR